MKKIEKMEKTPRFLLGLIAGVVGGLAGTAAMVVAERINAPRGEGQGERDMLALKGQTTGTGTQAAHWALGAVAGGVYGMVAEIVPQVTDGKGAAFGMVMNFAVHDPAIQAVGLAPKGKGSAQGYGDDLQSHALYGVTAEFVRRHTRSLLERRAVKQAQKAERLPARHVKSQQQA